LGLKTRTNCEVGNIAANAFVGPDYMLNAALTIAIAVVVYIEQTLNGNAPQWKKYIDRSPQSQLSFSSATNHSIASCHQSTIQTIDQQLYN
jgi:hypothetical protein